MENSNYRNENIERKYSNNMERLKQYVKEPIFKGKE